MYTTLKIVHVLSAVLSISGFVLRGVWMLKSSALLHSKAARILPHVNDTILLASAIALAVMLQQYPFSAHWLTAKLIALLVYIILGTIALKRGKTLTQRRLAFFLAIVVFAYIVAVAATKQILPGLA